MDEWAFEMSNGYFCLSNGYFCLSNGQMDICVCLMEIIDIWHQLIQNSHAGNAFCLLRAIIN